MITTVAVEYTVGEQKVRMERKFTEEEICRSMLTEKQFIHEVQKELKKAVYKEARKSYEREGNEVYDEDMD